MRIGREDETRQRPVRHGAAVATLLLLPFLVVVGSLTPDLVSVQYEEEEEPATREREPYAPLPLPRRVLHTAQEVTNRFLPGMPDLERLFAKPRYRTRRASGSVPLPRFPQTRGDIIVMNDIDHVAPEVVSKGSLQPGVVADATATWDRNLFDVIPNTTTPGRASVHYDDLMGEEEEDEPPAPVVPEPATAALLALGVIGLALRARQRQPATS
ncbi:MAG TPA: PEP-CTERM sorting domain-containing protein [Myxococcota bacterium]